MAYEYFDKLTNEARRRYSDKLHIAGLVECPFRLPSDDFINDPTGWPNLEYADLYNYLIETPGKKINIFF